ncbi:MAG TPA: hypothetical protein DCS43_11055 [Verrucomicrobia bacterium]|nr:hypothetical protein [Verrucomicrobiota bacterium]
MKAEYDLSNLKKRRNPYASRLKKQVTIRMGTDIISYFKTLAEESGIPYQNLVNLYLRDCVELYRKLDLKWASSCWIPADGHRYKLYGKSSLTEGWPMLPIHEVLGDGQPKSFTVQQGEGAPHSGSGRGGR